MYFGMASNSIELFSVVQSDQKHSEGEMDYLRRKP